MLTFDLGRVSSADVQLDIDLTATTSNGGIDPVSPFRKSAETLRHLSTPGKTIS